jgi:Helix-turn-helix domain
MQQHEERMTPMTQLFAERTIEMDAAFDPVTRSGFTQLPNFILTNGDLSLGAKVTYAMFLHYAWHANYCFPGQDRLATDMGMSQQRVSDFIKELERAGFIEIRRRGQGKTNIYKIKFSVRQKARGGKSNTGLSKSRHRPVGIKLPVGRNIP